MPTIKNLIAREVLDSRGNPTIEVVAESERQRAWAIVPSGASTGAHEALELRDGDQRRFGGKGVLKAVNHVNNKIKRKVRGMKVHNQQAIDELLITMDGTENKSNLGANAILGVSLACAKLAAAEAGVPLYKSIGDRAALLPVPMMNVMNGGVHANSGLEFQEIMIVPAGAATFREALRMGAEIFHTLQKLIGEKHMPTTVGDEGGFAPPLKSHEAALDLLMKAIEKAGYKAGQNVWLALDVAASEFYSRGVYNLKMNGAQKKVKAPELIGYFEKLVHKYPIVSIEDGCAEDDWDGWKGLTDRLGNKMQLVGDDLFVTNPKRLQMGFDEHIANSILIKLNQIGTLSETLDVMRMARQHKYTQVVSHRSGESEDTTIAHLAVGMETGQIKTGSLSRSDRVAKYNELLRIEEELGRRARYAGKNAFAKI
ncbi:phosphopyruvate hydratase [Candidatus Peregrinibacteria bacterium CG11_big_fil_rev_8_21_14_0_20_46_8]|nr:MAG: phosphopyruvate hydratase [Candidatus Peregrinibacteria bacterium CG11_big_fil_rev_8_21_14_0_20_46_8]